MMLTIALTFKAFLSRLQTYIRRILLHSKSYRLIYKTVGLEPNRDTL